MPATAYRTRTVTADSLRSVVSAIFRKAGMPEADANFMGQCLVDADLRALNPLSWAAPTDRAWSVNLDMATSIIAGSKLGMAIEKGEKIPLGWALDENGQPTDDPAAAQKGTLLPVGGPKGYGMSVVLDVLSGVLSGATFGKGLGGPGGGHFFQATDIEAFVPLDEFKQRMGELVDQIKSSQLAPGSTGIFLPGE